LNWYDFKARPRDAILPLFLTIDPLAEKYYSVSPYAYCLNNPVRYLDPTGMDPEDNEWHRDIFQWIKNLFIIEIDPQNIEKSKQIQEKKNEIIQQTTEGINTLSDILLLFHPFGSVIELATDLTTDNPDAALAAIPFAILDVATMGEGKAAKVITQWGWTGTKVWKNLVNEVGKGATIERLVGKIPTRTEAEMLIKEAKGTIIRIDPPHDFPNPHNYSHLIIQLRQE
jgi:hypothetical protein